MQTTCRSVGLSALLLLLRSQCNSSKQNPGRKVPWETERERDGRKGQLARGDKCKTVILPLSSNQSSRKIGLFVAIVRRKRSERGRPAGAHDNSRSVGRSRAFFVGTVGEKEDGTKEVRATDGKGIERAREGREEGERRNLWLQL